MIDSLIRAAQQLHSYRSFDVLGRPRPARPTTNAGLDSNRHNFLLPPFYLSTNNFLVKSAEPKHQILALFVLILRLFLICKNPSYFIFKNPIFPPFLKIQFSRHF